MQIFGEGVPLYLQLARAGDKFIDFGATIVGKPVTKTIKVVNNSAASVQIIVDFWERLPAFFVEKTVAKDEFEHERLEPKIE